MAAVGNSNGFVASHSNAFISERSDAFSLANMRLNFLLVSGNDARRCSGMGFEVLVSIVLVIPSESLTTKL